MGDLEGKLFPTHLIKVVKSLCDGKVVGMVKGKTFINTDLKVR